MSIYSREHRSVPCYVSLPNLSKGPVLNFHIVSSLFRNLYKVIGRPLNPIANIANITFFSADTGFKSISRPDNFLVKVLAQYT